MVIPKMDVGMGLKDIRVLAKVSIVKRAIRIWSDDQSLWSE